MSARENTTKRTLRASLSARPTAIGHPNIGLLAALLLPLLGLILALAPRAEAFVYWTVQEAGTIGRANLDGTGVDQSFITDAVTPYGVAVDAAHLYWTDEACDDLLGCVGSVGTIARANLDGTGVDRRFIPGLGSPRGVAVDDEHIYWDDPIDGTIGRANLDGTGVDQSFITDAVSPRGVAVDDEHVYWANDGPPGTIGRANLDGTGVDQDFITRTHPRQGLSSPTGVAVDDEHVYWINFVDVIGRANLDGTGVDRRFITREGNVNLSGVAVDDEHVYWGNQIEAKKGTIGRAKLNGRRADNRFIAGVNGISQLAVDPLRSFSFGNVKRNKEKGTARLAVKVPGPGEAALAENEEVKPNRKQAEAAGKVKLPINPRGKAKKELKRKGKAKVKAEVAYSPQGGDPSIVGNTDIKTVKLIKRG